MCIEESENDIQTACLLARAQRPSHHPRITTRAHTRSKYKNTTPGRPKASRPIAPETDTSEDTYPLMKPLLHATQRIRDPDLHPQTSNCSLTRVPSSSRPNPSRMNSFPPIWSIAVRGRPLSRPAGFRASLCRICSCSRSCSLLAGS